MIQFQETHIRLCLKNLAPEKSRYPFLEISPFVINETIEDIIIARVSSILKSIIDLDIETNLGGIFLVVKLADRGISSDEIEDILLVSEETKAICNNHIEEYLINNIEFNELLYDYVHKDEFLVLEKEYRINRFIRKSLYSLFDIDYTLEIEKEITWEKLNLELMKFGNIYENNELLDVWPRKRNSYSALASWN